MRVRRAAVGIVAIVIVVGAFALVLPQTGLLYTTTKIQTFTTTVFENTRETGTCTATSYLVPDTVEVSATEVTVTSGNSTYSSLSTTTIYPGTATEGTTTYSVLTYVNGTSSFVITSTSTDYDDAPSDGWSVIVCSFPR